MLMAKQQRLVTRSILIINNILLAQTKLYPNLTDSVNLMSSQFDGFLKQRLSIINTIKELEERNKCLRNV